MSEIIVITSGKGGVGKTTTSANVGTGLAILGKKVVLIDTDIGLRNLDVVMGLENRIVYNLVDVVEGNCRMKQALIKDKRYPNLFLLPSAQTRDKTSVNPGQMVKLVDDLRVALTLGSLHALAYEEAGNILACLEVGNSLFVLGNNVLYDGQNCALVGYLLETHAVNDGLNGLVGLEHARQDLLACVAGDGAGLDQLNQSNQLVRGHLGLA